MQKESFAFGNSIQICIEPYVLCSTTASVIINGNVPASSLCLMCLSEIFLSFTIELHMKIGLILNRNAN